MKNLLKRLFNYLIHNILFIILLGVFIAIDQVSKTFFDGKNIVVIDGVFSFTSSHNTGAGWSILSGRVWLLILISIVFLIAIFVFNYFQKHKNMLYKTSFVFIVAGAIGNLADRLFFGYVRDFLSFDLINFPVFNFADTCLTIGVILLCIYLIFVEPKLKKNSKPTQNKKSKQKQETEEKIELSGEEIMLLKGQDDTKTNEQKEQE